MMKKITLSFSLLWLIIFSGHSQGPAITSWLQNTTETGTYYIQGNDTAIDNNILYNCQLVEYTDDFVYVHTRGIPAYPTGPFSDGNPSIASDQDAIYKIPLFPLENTGNPSTTTGGNIGVFINGVSLFDYRDGVGWNPNTMSLCGGPGRPPCPGGPMAGTDWNRDAIPAERPGFDCSKAHPAMGNYHHHQNPSAFKLDLEVVSDICDIYDADGLYAINAEQHSPLIGYAYDGFPIYGAYGFKNLDGTGGIVRIKSSYELRNITTRTTHADGSTVDVGPDISTTYPLGYFREDYAFVAHPGEPDFLDEHNGRISVTPEYPNGTYAYFATVDDNWNSAYPYVVGPTFYGTRANRKVDAVTEPTTVYDITTSITETAFKNMSLSIFPNPASDLIAIQINDLVEETLTVTLIDQLGKVVQTKLIQPGTTIAYLDTETLYAGAYFVKIANGEFSTTKKVVLQR